jgi:hypothetical protein
MLIVRHGRRPSYGAVLLVVTFSDYERMWWCEEAAFVLAEVDAGEANRPWHSRQHVMCHSNEMLPFTLDTTRCITGKGGVVKFRSTQSKSIKLVWDIIELKA